MRSRRSCIVLQFAAATVAVDVVAAQQNPPEAVVQAPVEVLPQTPAPKTEPDEDVDLFHDPETGEFDASNFLATRTGFLPVLIPITEPAVGYGLGAAAAFFHAPPRLIQSADGERLVPPIITAIFGMATENGSFGAGVAHIHNWHDGDIRYVGAGGFASLNLDWFGQGDQFGTNSFSYNIEAIILVQKLTFRLGDSNFFAGPTQRLFATQSKFDDAPLFGPTEAPIDITERELDSTISGLGLTLAYDTRNSQFAPTKGIKSTLDFTQYGEVMGSDYDYSHVNAEICDYIPLGGAFSLGLRGQGEWVGDDAPFYDLPWIHLRGIEAGRYVDNTAFTAESELRFDANNRWTYVGFGGVGWIADQPDELGDTGGHFAGGVGFRYLLASKYDLRIGLDVAAGPEDAAVYVTIGTGWVRD